MTGSPRGGVPGNISLGAAVGRVVADHEGVEEPAPGHFRRECPLVTRNSDPANHPFPLRAEGSRARRLGGDLVPLVYPLDVVEGEQVDVVGPEDCEGRLEVPSRRRSAPCADLAHTTIDRRRDQGKKRRQ